MCEWRKGSFMVRFLRLAPQCFAFTSSWFIVFKALIQVNCTSWLFYRIGNMLCPTSSSQHGQTTVSLCVVPRWWSWSQSCGLNREMRRSISSTTEALYSSAHRWWSTAVRGLAAVGRIAPLTIAWASWRTRVGWMWLGPWGNFALREPAPYRPRTSMSFATGPSLSMGRLCPNELKRWNASVMYYFWNSHESNSSLTCDKHQIIIPSAFN